MSSSIRGANAISDAEFLAAYNNEAYNNAAVLTALNTDWTAIGVKLRSERVKLHCTVLRTGGKSGTWTAVNPLPAEAQIWKETGAVRQKPERGSYVPLAATNALAAAPAAVPTSTTLVAAPVASVAPTEAPTAAPTVAPANTVSFKAEIFGTVYEFEGATLDDALHALFIKLRELNFSKVQITNRATGRPVGMNEIRSGGTYKFSKQLTAARPCALLDPWFGKVVSI